MTTMKAAVIHEAVDPRFSKLKASYPTPQSGEVLIRVKAFGLNAPSCSRGRGIRQRQVPRVLGIEAVGVVESAPGSDFRKGDRRRDRYGRHGTAVRRRLCRIHLRARDTGAGR